MIREAVCDASAFEADVTRADDCRDMVESGLDRYGGLYILFKRVAISPWPGASMTCISLQAP